MRGKFSTKITESQSRKSVKFSQEEEEEIPNYETQARKAARKAVGETKIEVVIDIIFYLLRQTDLFWKYLKFQYYNFIILPS